jgi:plastocyanin
MKVLTLTRRQFLLAAGIATAGELNVWTVHGQTPSTGSESTADNIPLIRSLRRFSDSLYCFDPVGLFVQPGETIRFIPGRSDITTLSAYHPDNDNHELRIPEAAEPFNFGFSERLHFDFILEVEGTYDYFSKYQEVVGMVGRIVVGRPGGPGEKPWGYGGAEGRNPIYKSILQTAALLNSQEIMQKKIVPFPLDERVPPYPLWD